MEEYCMKAKPMRPAQDSIEMDDFYDDDCYDMDDMDDDEDDDELSENEVEDKNESDAEDSGNGESWKLFTTLNQIKEFSRENSKSKLIPKFILKNFWMSNLQPQKQNSS